MYQADLTIIAEKADEREEENARFRAWNKDRDERSIDQMVHTINHEVSSAIDCTECGNCCKNLVINVEPSDAISCAGSMNMKTEDFLEKYIETSAQGQFFISAIPCHFFAEKKCTIYENRFTACREFPHLHKEGFLNRLSGTMMHYGKCPIIYNVVEELKLSLQFPG